jgi:hypothetical protein
MVLPAHSLQAVEGRLISANNKGHFTFEAEMVFRRISPRIAVGLLSNTT